MATPVWTLASGEDVLLVGMGKKSGSLHRSMGIPADGRFHIYSISYVSGMDIDNAARVNVSDAFLILCLMVLERRIECDRYSSYTFASSRNFRS
jgi:hypothetical protein